MEGKVVLITGGSSGIGRDTALAFAKEGARVVIAARGVERGEATAHEICAAGGRAIFVRADMAKTADVAKLVPKTVKTYGRLDYAFNNAATEGTPNRTAEFTEKEYDEILRVNLKAVWLAMKDQIRQMLQQQPAGGAIVNTSSINGLGGVAGGALYAATKAAVISLSKSAAQEYAQQGIRVNALVAGGFDTPMLRRVFERAGGGDPAQAKAVEEQISQMVPLRRIGLPEEAAQAVLWLCSDAASYVTGHSMIVDGGLTAWAR
ncbi:MAG TPA: glucose 1-dehydrogenase [Thermoanaerobaculia bacterium]|nr:glucose 1-dehydrogenase [Thermoanaerobaculia bacterium]